MPDILRDPHLLALAELVASAPGQTALQLAEIIGAEREPLLDRLYTLQRDGLAHSAEITRCPRTGHLANVWRPGRDPMLTAEREYANAMEQLAPPDPLSAADVAA